MGSVALVTDRLNMPWAVGAPLTKPSGRFFLSPVGLALLGGAFIAVLFKLVDWTVELLWFRARSYEEVFWRLLSAEVAMFAIAFIPAFVYVLLNLLVLARLAGVAQPNAHRLTPLLIVGSLAAAAIFGFVLCRVGSIPALGLGPGFREV
jgi:Uncharacterised protein family (UPF0182)